MTAKVTGRCPEVMPKLAREVRSAREATVELNGLHRNLSAGELPRSFVQTERQQQLQDCNASYSLEQVVAARSSHTESATDFRDAGKSANLLDPRQELTDPLVSTVPRMRHGNTRGSTEVDGHTVKNSQLSD